MDFEGEKKIKIEEFIKTVKKETEKEYLNKFMKAYPQTDSIIVSDSGDYFEILVSHPESNGKSGGAEGFTLNKKSGEVKMTWHEHPMKLPHNDEIKARE